MRNGNIIVTGGSGFIGTAFLHYLFDLPDWKGTAVNIDKLTYAGNGLNNEDLVEKYGLNRYFFYHEDICTTAEISKIIEKHEIKTIVHFAAESHVDRSILSPVEFIRTNVTGTLSMLDAARSVWGNSPDCRFHHISTDEVYGSLGNEGYFYENTPYDPKSPYSASKAASDHLVRAYSHTYGMNCTISNCSNNYGPWQFPEKLIPLMICNMQKKLPLPVYGKGLNVRDWLYVFDHASAIDTIITNSDPGESWNIGGDCEKRNIDILHTLIDVFANCTGDDAEELKNLITYVTDRPGHDFRYAINHNKLTNAFGWKPSVDLNSGLEKTVRWYLENPSWIESIETGSYLDWLSANYEKR